MDWVTWKENGISQLKKYKYAALILLIGIFLMVLPGKKESSGTAPPQETAPPQLQQALSQLLSRVEGAGKVEVLLTEAAGARTIYQMDENVTQSDRSEDTRRDTVLVTAAGREETGLVRQVISPQYQGAVILCQGADRAQVKLSIVEAVKSVTGLSADKITVLKMK